MTGEKIEVSGRQVEGFIIPLGPVNLVFIVTEKGLIGCGAFDVMALDKFGYPAARVKSIDNSPVSTVDNLLSCIIKDANVTAKALGIEPGMPVLEAVKFL